MSSPFKNPLPEGNQTINFHSEEIDFSIKNKDGVIDWIKSSIHKEDKNLHSLNFIFCSDAYLHKINLDFLNHDTLTDVITFPYSENEHIIEGDIFISIDRIKENAKTFKATFDQELSRVIIHGVLHLMGYSDKSLIEKEEMTKKENIYLRDLKMT